MTGRSPVRPSVLAGATVALALTVLVAGSTGRATLPRAVPLAVRATPASSASARSRLEAARTFALAIGDGDLSGDLTARYRGYDLVVVDGQEATAAQVAALRQGGRVVLAYLDVGTIEPGRPWFARARPYRLNRWSQWGEWYANISKAGYRRLVAGAVAPGILAKGFDGLFLDNVDMVESHPRQSAAMGALVRSLAHLVHSAGGLLFAQNGADILRPLVGDLDGWNREDVSFTYDFARHSYRRTSAAELGQAQSELRRMSAAGLRVTATDYLAGGPGAGSDALVAAQNACSARALPFVSDIGLRRVPQPPLRCPG
ncbi:MAG TPA: endo alpha-1,4 polygalactosaminidase [Solirubrobacteraceae bacterium]|nr:endo alpha-1,4 polygalactosaminidase [Solirubrobacteraceae bacterium]